RGGRVGGGGVAGPGGDRPSLRRRGAGGGRLFDQAAVAIACEVSSIRTGSTIAFSPANCSRRWSWYAVSLWRSRWYQCSSSKTSLPAKKIDLGNSTATSRQSWVAPSTASVPIAMRAVAASPSPVASSTYLSSEARVCSFTSSTSATFLKVAESMTPTERKTKFWK